MLVTKQMVAIDFHSKEKIRSTDICHFFIYRHRPISVFSIAFKVFKVRHVHGQPRVIGAVEHVLPHVKDPKPKLLEDSTRVLGDKRKA